MPVCSQPVQSGGCSAGRNSLREGVRKKGSMAQRERERREKGKEGEREGGREGGRVGDKEPQVSSREGGRCHHSQQALLSASPPLFTYSPHSPFSS